MTTNVNFAVFKDSLAWTANVLLIVLMELYNEYWRIFALRKMYLKFLVSATINKIHSYELSTTMWEKTAARMSNGTAASFLCSPKAVWYGLSVAIAPNSSDEECNPVHIVFIHVNESCSYGKNMELFMIMHSTISNKQLALFFLLPFY